MGKIKLNFKIEIVSECVSVCVCVCVCVSVCEREKERRWKISFPFFPHFVDLLLSVEQQSEESRLAEGQQLYNTRVGMVWTWRTVASWSCLYCVVDLECLCTLVSSRAKIVHQKRIENLVGTLFFGLLLLVISFRGPRRGECNGGVCGCGPFCGWLFNRLMHTTSAPITARSVAD